MTFSLWPFFPSLTHILHHCSVERFTDIPENVLGAGCLMFWSQIWTYCIFSMIPSTLTVPLTEKHVHNSTTWVLGSVLLGWRFYSIFAKSCTLFYLTKKLGDPKFESLSRCFARARWALYVWLKTFEFFFFFWLFSLEAKVMQSSLDWMTITTYQIHSN